VRVIDGELPLNEAQRQILTVDEIQAGWRLACQTRVTRDFTLEMRQWEAAILTDDSTFEFIPRDGLGVAVDVGTTTLVAQLLDLRNGNVLAVKTALNPQARHGADVMSRVHFAVAEGGGPELTDVIRAAALRLIRQTCSAAEVKPDSVTDVVLVGNTVMHHLFGGFDLTPLAYYPFEPEREGLIELSPADVGWDLAPRAVIRFLPCLGGFVGSDILAGILATGIHLSNELVALVDLGTNGEIVVGNQERILCAGTAAGPAFEGARISCGMRAATGAIWKVSEADGFLLCETLGSVEPRGICGSGLVDAVAAGLKQGRIRTTGKLLQGECLPLTGSICLTQADIRQLQLAKGAIAAGLRILRARIGVPESEIKTVFLGGAFGNYVDRDSARRIGLLEFPSHRVQAAGNTALQGAKIALYDNGDGHFAEIRTKVEPIALHADSRFQDAYVEAMSYPDPQHG
jgi:uncharacterized 2Fe-2S/4Fe-4S cluster protein (DUF4445 family)